MTGIALGVLWALWIVRRRRPGPDLLSQAARPVSRDAVLLATLAVEPGFSGQGLGRVLLQAMARDLTKRRVRAAEAFADRAWNGRRCHLPAAFLEASGFQVVREHPRYPL